MTNRSEKSVTPSPLLSRFPQPPPEPTPTALLPGPGQPGSWDDVFDLLPIESEAPSLAGTYWTDPKRPRDIWRFDPDGGVACRLSKRISINELTWKQRGPWFMNVFFNRGGEWLGRFEGDALAAYIRRPFTPGLQTFELRRASPGKALQAFDAEVLAWREFCAKAQRR